MAPRWTKAQIEQIAIEEREELGLSLHEPLDPSALCERHGIPVYDIASLDDCPIESVDHFMNGRTKTWSAALVPVGTARLIVENTSHLPERRRATIAHEIGHHLLEHEFSEALIGDDGHTNINATQENQATYMATQLLIPKKAANKAAFAGHDNARVAAQYGVSEQFAQLGMYGARVYAARALAKQGRR